MDGGIIATMVLAVIFYGLYNLFKLGADSSLKKMLIRSNMLDQAEKVLKNENNQVANEQPTLKWGLVALAAGIGAIVIWVIIYSFGMFNPGHYFGQYYEGWLFGGIELVFISLGFLVYYVLTRKNRS
ncbi:MAG: hypothetical protein Q8862_08060 [Bacteroidota bacterium]|nr:hypothetical protein [Bacteroidota bacterium]MDP4205658.1 hypothetical protein [Bacteroidota bacterium]